MAAPRNRQNRVFDTGTAYDVATGVKLLRLLIGSPNKPERTSLSVLLTKADCEALGRLLVQALDSWEDLEPCPECSEARRLKRLHHKVHDDMDGKTCLLAECELHYPRCNRCGRTGQIAKGGRYA